LIAVLLSGEFYTLYLFDRNGRGRDDAKLSICYRVRSLCGFASQHYLIIPLLSHVFNLIGCAIILGGALPDFESLEANSDWYTDSANLSSTSRRHLKARGGEDDGGADEFDGYTIVNELTWPALYFMQSMSILFACLYAMLVSFLPNERLSVLFNTIIKMLIGDIAPFIIVWLAFITTFWMTLYVLYPRGGANQLPHVAKFNEGPESFLALLDLSFVGEPVDIEILAQETLLSSDNVLSPWQLVDLATWGFFYYSWLIISLVLLVNLLIAMMSATYSEVFGEATLQARLSLAKHVFKLELIATQLATDSSRMARMAFLPFDFTTHVGARQPGGKHVYVFKAIDRDPNDDSDSDDGYEGDFGNGSDPFAPPVPSQMSRLHDFTKGMYEEVMERLESISNDKTGRHSCAGRHSYGDVDSTPGSPGGVAEESTWYRRKRRSHVGKKSHPCTKALTQLRAQMSIENALKAGRDASGRRLPGAIDKVVTMQRFTSACIGDRCVAACAPGSH